MESFRCGQNGLGVVMRARARKTKPHDCVSNACKVDLEELLRSSDEALKALHWYRDNARLDSSG
jgi:hypothetical protein